MSSADTDSDYGDCFVSCLRHGELRVFGRPLPGYFLAG
jgi:hypothetical protein